jgi:glycerol-3-phosphate dehydrogenase subunit B
VRRVVVVGAGIAGTGAALAATRAGAQATIVDGGTGASTLATGAIDAEPWETSGPAAPLPAGVCAVLDALASHRTPSGGARLVTTAGIVRPARGYDAALLDVAPVARGHVAVVGCARWDAAALARAWSGAGERSTGARASEPARSTRFTVVEAAILRLADERAMPDADFAARHDDEARLGWMAERLRDALSRTDARFDALVLPPALGVDRARADALSKLVGLPCGEAMALPGGPSGLRFEASRDRALARAAVHRVQSRATRVGRVAGGWCVEADGGDPIVADALVVATGGLVGGGLAYTPSDAMPSSVLPPYARPTFHATLDAPFMIGAHGRVLELPGSLYGVAPESIAWPFVPEGSTFERAGVLCEADGRVAEGLYVAGEIVADAPRTWLAALASGGRAGAAAAVAGVTASAGQSQQASPSPGAAPPSRP